MATNPAPSSYIQMGQNFLFLIFETKIQKYYVMRHSLNYWTLVLFYKGCYICQFEIFCCREKGIFVNFSTDSKISLCSRALFLRHVVGQNQSYRIALSDFKNWLLTRKTSKFREFMSRPRFFKEIRNHLKM